MSKGRLYLERETGATVWDPLHCEMVKGCNQPVSHIDVKGYVYCETHGKQRRMAGTRCRKLRPEELKKLRHGETLSHY